jgi:hypothetical protein
VLAVSIVAISFLLTEEEVSRIASLLSLLLQAKESPASSKAAGIRHFIVGIKFLFGLLV